HHRTCVGQRMGPNLAKRRAGLVTQQIDDVTWPIRTECAEPPEKSLASKGCVSAERQRAYHVGTAANAAVEKDRGAAPHLRPDRRQHVDGRRRSHGLTAAALRA